MFPSKAVRIKNRSKIDKIHRQTTYPSQDSIGLALAKVSNHVLICVGCLYFGIAAVVSSNGGLIYSRKLIFFYFQIIYNLHSYVIHYKSINQLICLSLNNEKKSEK